MKLALIALAAALAKSDAKSVTPSASISATSKVGSKLIAGARRLEDANEEIDFTWVEKNAVFIFFK